MHYSAYIPCYNNEDTIFQAIESVQKQTQPPNQIFVLDDGSRDNSGKEAKRSGVTVIRHEKNQGRGATRAEAITRATEELVLCCDATNVLDPHFFEKACTLFEDKKVAAVHGWWIAPQKDYQNTAERWRARHLFKSESNTELSSDQQITHTTGGALVRKSALEKVGNYSPSLRYGEDAELGKRLLQAGFKVLTDPTLTFTCMARGNMINVLERYWRWNLAPNHPVPSLRDYLKNIGYSLKVMCRSDWKAHDYLSMPLSLFCPHYQFWKTLFYYAKNTSYFGPPFFRRKS